MTSSEVEFCLSKRGKDVHLLKRCQITRRNVIGPFSPKGPSRNKRYYMAVSILQLKPVLLEIYQKFKNGSDKVNSQLTYHKT
ncbi:hypothetical protein HanHA300_Chr06g0216461 [Helianthus annuus]|nr:hypothetical protein HanHA300_Chr06g0216461 [Helianthus annuus]KAJ0573925.1 hypothetical protein HanHA89_Chr06g0232261 [Helianthus annuus]KAJ0738259.1 hypothetical protein HanLR1_Chr06g0216181 [Helianthus annuus]